jgi:hypothetical protein
VVQRLCLYNYFIFNWFLPLCNVQLIKRCENSAQHSVWPLYCVNYYAVFVGLQQFGCCMFSVGALVHMLFSRLIVAFCTCSDAVFCVQYTLYVSAWWRDLLPSSTICNAMLTAGFSFNWLTTCVGTFEQRHLSECGALERSSPFKNQ